LDNIDELKTLKDFEQYCAEEVFKRRHQKDIDKKLF
jgi:hypothetical protein